MARTKKQIIKHREYLPWIEKYRPRNMDEIAHQSHVVSTLKNSIKSCNLTHLLFYGPAGTGKTSTILALARQLYGYNHDSPTPIATNISKIYAYTDQIYSDRVC